MTIFRHLPKFLAAMGVAVGLAGCGVNTIPTKDQAVKAAWANVQGTYQRRADLIPNLVETVKGYAAHEQETLTAVIEARAKATSIQVDASTLDNPEKLKQFQQAQDQLTGALSRLMVVSERYPDLKANQNFQHLQSRISGLEDAIADRREFYNESVNTNNIRIEQFPDVIIARMFNFIKRELLQFSQEELKDVNLQELFK